MLKSQSLWKYLGRHAAIAGLAILVAALTPRPAVSAEGVALGYEGYLIGMHLMTLEVEMASSDTAYRMETKSTVNGIVGWIYGWSSSARTEGEVRPDGTLNPRWHERDIQRPGRRAKAIQIEYNDEGIPRIARMRIGDEANFREDTDSRGTMDPISAVLAVMDQMTAGAACSGEFPVFDGKERYNVTATVGKPTNLKGNKHMMYKGETTRCDLLLETVEKNHKKVRFNSRNPDQALEDDSLVIIMWFASPADGMPPLPVMVASDTGFGTMRLYLSRAENAILPIDGLRAEAR